MVVLVFVDGVGIGPRGSHNPFDGAGSAYFASFAGEPLAAPHGGFAAATDTRLGVEGLPQSATGQTTIITGENAAAVLGRHLSAFPGGSLRALLRERSLFRRLADRGFRTAHANVAPSEIAGRRVRTISAMTVAAEEAGLRPRSLEDLRGGRALHHEFTNASLIAYGCSVPPIEPFEAGRRLARIADGHDFTAFEYFATDAAGHACDAEAVRRHAARLDAFLDGALGELELERDTLVLTSDHGNAEDVSSSAHTLNPVATVAWGNRAEGFAARVSSLLDVAPAIERVVAGGQN